MPTPRLVTIAVPTTAETTFFGLDFSTDSGATWTAYNPGSGADIDVAALDDGALLLDGVNAPSGNAAAASYAGNLYRIRLKTSGGYGNYSNPFKAGYEPDEHGPVADIAQLLQDFRQIGVEFDFTTQEETDAFLARLLTDAMDYIRIQPDTSALYSSAALTAAQTRYLAMTERYLAVAQALESAATLKAMGLHAPLLVEDSASLLEIARYYTEKAEARVATLISGLGEDPAEPGAFSIPAFFTTASACRGR